MDSSQIKTFTHKLDQLLNYCQKLEDDNVSLKLLQEEWQGERSKLLQKNDLARNKIESMIDRLKALENN